MAGTADGDNPVAVNVVPMVDVLFCLCVFFLCSLRTVELGGKFDTWLPMPRAGGLPWTVSPPEIRVVPLLSRPRTAAHFHTVTLITSVS